jgi:hypothetical protein
MGILRRFSFTAASFAIAVICASTVSAQVHVRGHYRQDGTYVRPHYRSAPDGNFSNNWSTIGNVNPYTGKHGTLVTPLSGYGSGESSGSRNGYSASTQGSSWNDGSGGYLITNPYVDSIPVTPVAKASAVQSPPTSSSQLLLGSRSTIEEMIVALEKAPSSERLKLAKKFAADESAVSWAELAMRMHLADMIAANGGPQGWRQYDAVSDMMDVLANVEREKPATAK